MALDIAKLKLKWRSIGEKDDFDSLYQRFGSSDLLAIKLITAPRSKRIRETIEHQFARRIFPRKSSAKKPVRSKHRGGRLWHNRRPGSAAVLPRVDTVFVVRKDANLFRALPTIRRFVQIAPVTER